MQNKKMSLLLRFGSLVGCLLLTLLSSCAKEPPIQYLEGTEFPIGLFKSGERVFRFYPDGTFRWSEGARGRKRKRGRWCFAYLILLLKYRIMNIEAKSNQSTIQP